MEPTKEAPLRWPVIAVRGALLLAGICCLVAQVRALSPLAQALERARAGPNPMDAFGPEMSYDQGIFHGIGTGLLIAFLLMLWAPEADRGGHRSLERRSYAALCVPLLSVGVWLWWAARGFPGADRVTMWMGIVAFFAGLVLPILSAVRVVRLRGHDAGWRRTLALAFIVLIWLWSLTFGAVQFAISLSV